MFFWTKNLVAAIMDGNEKCCSAKDVLFDSLL